MSWSDDILPIFLYAGLSFPILRVVERHYLDHIPQFLERRFGADFSVNHPRWFHFLWFCILFGGTIFTLQSINITLLLGLRWVGDRIISLSNEQSSLLTRSMAAQAFVPICFIAAVAFYKLRCARPVIYGVVEVLIGNVIVCAATIATEAAALNRALGVATGIYVVVRGLDNVDRGISGQARLAWDDLFKKRGPKQ